MTQDSEDTPDISQWFAAHVPLIQADTACLKIPCPGSAIPCPNFTSATLDCSGPLCWTCHELLDADGRCPEHG